MKTLTLSLLILALALPCLAQTTVDLAPAYFAGAGMGFSRTGAPQITGTAVFGMRAANTEGTWACLEFDNITGTTSTMQAGILQQLAKRGNWSLLAIGQAGGATDGAGAITAVFGGGGGPAYSLRGIHPKLDGLSVAGLMKVLKINGQDVTLGFYGWLTKSF